MFLPVTKKELKERGIEQPDIIFVSGDTYIDSPYSGIAVIGKYLEKHGFSVAIIAQPDVNSPSDITALGEPKLFWGVSGGAVDSMVANYTALKKKIQGDDATPGEVNNKRPDRAVIKYSNLIRQHYKDTAPIVLGGIEASLRRIAHYDFWSNKIRKPIIFDAKADYIVYGEGERTILELACALRNGEDTSEIRGLSYIAKQEKEGYLNIPSYLQVSTDKYKFIDMFHTFYRNNDPLNAKGLVQQVDNRYLIQNPPNIYLEGKELDEVYSLDYENEVHPHYAIHGKVRAMDTIRFSINSHRGCYGECNFCAIAVHQGRKIRSRSENSILDEAKRYKNHPKFKGIISDVGGASTNMYNNHCPKQDKLGSCQTKRCLFPDKCKSMQIDHKDQISILSTIRKMEHVKKVFTGSGLRYDLVMEDKQSGKQYFKQLVDHHISGQLKIAPEHAQQEVLDLMGKPAKKHLLDFRKEFIRLNEQSGKKQFLTYYFIAAHPGCEYQHMVDLKKFVSKELKLNPEQVQVFTPTPSTYSTLMFYTGLDPWTLEPLSVEKEPNKKKLQKEALTSKRYQQSRPNQNNKLNSYNKPFKKR